MKPIKFRAWDKSLEEMRYSINIPSDYTERNGSLDLINMFQTLNQRYVFMQYTGLKAINGEDIYEGDIVETDLGKGIVVFDSAAFLIRNLEDDEYYGFDDFFSLYEGGCYLVEVIGNIYEHPHLLEGNNDA